MADFPPELWLAICALLPRSDVANVSLLNRQFCTFAQPLLFTSTTFHFYKAGIDDVGAFPFLFRDGHKSLLDKLEFCTFPRIAAAIIRCDIGHPDGEFQWILKSSRSDPILFDLFSALPRLTHVKEITLRMIQIAPFHLSQMRAMPYVESLVLISCGVSDSGFLTDLPVSEISLRGRLMYEEPVLPLWQRILKPAHLRALYTDLPYCDDIMSELRRLGPWPVLRQLAIDTPSDISPLSSHFLYQCPQLEELYIYEPSSADFSEDEFQHIPQLFIPPGAVSQLATYCGPPETVASAMAGRAIRHLGITSGFPYYIEHIFTAAGDACARLETLQISFDGLTLDFLSTIAARCLNVRVLHLRELTTAPLSPNRSTSMSQILEHAKFPQQVETVYIKLNAPAHAAVLPEEEHALRAVAASYPALRDFALVLHDYQIHFDPKTGTTLEGDQVNRLPPLRPEHEFQFGRL